VFPCCVIITVRKEVVRMANSGILREGKFFTGLKCVSLCALIFGAVKLRNWRSLHNDELNDLYSSSNIVRVIKSRRMRWGGYMARMGEERGLYRVLVGKAEGKRPLGRHRRRWVDNIRMDL